MKLFDLLQRHGLFHGLSGDHIRWFETMAAEADVDLAEGEESYPVIGMNGIQNCDCVYFDADAEVEDAGIHDENWIAIKDLGGCRRVFNAYRVLTPKEVLAG